MTGVDLFRLFFWTWMAGMVGGGFEKESGGAFIEAESVTVSAGTAWGN